MFRPTFKRIPDVSLAVLLLLVPDGFVQPNFGMYVTSDTCHLPLAARR